MFYLQDVNLCYISIMVPILWLCTSMTRRITLCWLKIVIFQDGCESIDNIFVIDIEVMTTSWKLTSFFQGTKLITFKNTETHHSTSYMCISYLTVLSILVLSTIYLTLHTWTSQHLNHNVNLTDLIYCVDIVNKVSVPFLVLLTVSNVQISTCF